MILNTRHTGLVVQDLDREIQFYVKLGLIVSERRTESGKYIEKLVGVDGAIIEWAKLRDPNGGMVELIEYKNGRNGNQPKQGPVNQVGSAHIAYSVRDIEEACRIVRGSGGSVVNTPQQSPDGKVKVVYCRDPEGILIELVEVLD